jgi:hypothetical protein
VLTGFFPSFPVVIKAPNYFASEEIVNQFRFMWLSLPAMLMAGTVLLQADTIGGAGSNCATCAGAAYTLTYSGAPISATATTEIFQITFTVNDNTYVGGGSFLNAVAIKVAPPSGLVSESLVSAPSGFSLLPGGLNAQGCGSGEGGFLCVQSSGNGVSVAGGPYNFVYDVTVDSGTLLTGTNAASVKARYLNSNGRFAGPLLSENITLQTTSPVPEPSSPLLLGSGLSALSLLLRRMRNAKANQTTV